MSLALPALACAQQPAATTPPESLAACASIADSAARLACYDKLASRPAAPAGEATPAAAQAAPSSPGVAAAAPATAPAPPPAAAPTPAAVPRSAGPAAAPSSPTAAAPARASAQSFGLYEAEHPRPAVSQSLKAQVLAVGESGGGKMTVSLEGGAMWELLDSSDPLLAAGDTVTITRGALGSFFMSTPTRRTHRVRRLD